MFDQFPYTKYAHFCVHAFVLLGNYLEVEFSFHFTKMKTARKSRNWKICCNKRVKSSKMSEKSYPIKN